MKREDSVTFANESLKINTIKIKNIIKIGTIAITQVNIERLLIVYVT